MNKNDFDGRLRLARTIFEESFLDLRDQGLVVGEFSASVWIYRGGKLTFADLLHSDAKRRTKQESRVLLERFFVIHCMRKSITRGSIVSRVAAFKLLADEIESMGGNWAALNRAVLDRTVSKISPTYSEKTAYTRAGGLRTFVKFLNAAEVTIDGNLSNLLQRHILWSPALKNPIRSQFEASLIEDSSSEKYSPELHLGLGRAHAAIRAEPSLEPVPGYDLIRLESLAFAMATGMRIGELTALSLSCLDEHEQSGTLFVRVATEKGQPPAARPIAEVWREAVTEAHAYLSSTCSAPRMRAKEIEKRGFKFVNKELRDARKKNPVDASLHSQIGVLELDPAQMYLVEEIVNVFDLSPKEFRMFGRFNHCVVDLPRVGAARVVQWMDERFEKWDWEDYVHGSDARLGQHGRNALSANRVGEYANEPNLARAKWFFKELSELLVELSAIGAFEDRLVGTDGRAVARRSWYKLRKLALSKTGGIRCEVVDINVFISTIKKMYKRHLEAHFRDFVSLDSHGSPTPGPDVRLGVPRKLSDHLIVVWENQFSYSNRLGIIPRPVVQKDFYNYLAAREARSTVFDRLSLKDSKGRIFSLTPHQIRHWVTTAILRSGTSERMVDLWMGRTPSQSRVYDHRTARERAQALRTRYLQGEPPNDHVGRQVEVWRRDGIDEVDIGELLDSRLRVLHFVPTGACSRDLFVAPCSKGLMCLKGFGTSRACPSFHIDVSDVQAERNISDLKRQYTTMLSALFPKMEYLKKNFEAELNETEVLDQHLTHILEVIRGCEQALKAYNGSNETREKFRKVELVVVT